MLIEGWLPWSALNLSYDYSSERDQWLFVGLPDEGVETPVSVVLNWRQELETLVPRE